MESSHPAPPFLPLALPVRVIVRKLVWMVIGALAGIPIGWLIRDQLYPWRQDFELLFAGALLGAVVGVIFPGKTLGRLGWCAVLGTLSGASFGGMHDRVKSNAYTLLGAIIGFVVGLIVGLVLEFSRRIPPNNKPAVPPIYH